MKSKLLIGLERYPEFKKAVNSIVENTINNINFHATKIPSEMPYKHQFILEEVIKKLEQHV